MMYQSKMALAVKVPARNKSSVAREIEDAVYLPFGCEYSLLIKNLNSVRALVKVWIDGTDVTDGTSLVVNPNQSFDLERFIKNGNLTEGNKFKFIERTAGISAHRGNKIDDGLIRIEFEFEKPRQPNVFIKTTEWPKWEPYSPYYDQLIGKTDFGEIKTYYSGIQGTADVAYGSCDGAFLNTTVASASASAAEPTLYAGPMRGRGTYIAPQAATQEVGITVAGSVSDQTFTHASWFPTDGVKHVMVLRVLGEVEGEPVKAPVTVKTKAPCTSCGRQNKAGAKFCVDCGTGLQIV